MRLSRIFLNCVVFLTLFVVSQTLYAQPGDPGDPGDNPVPISGVELLLLSGGALGGYKLLRNKIRKT